MGKVQDGAEKCGARWGVGSRSSFRPRRVSCSGWKRSPDVVADLNGSFDAAAGRRLDSYITNSPRTEKPRCIWNNGREWVVLLPYLVFCGLRLDISYVDD
jgi:hypothetical protein